MRDLAMGWSHSARLSGPFEVDRAHFELKEPAIAQVAERSAARRIGTLRKHREFISPCGWGRFAGETRAEALSHV
jgi:hypothetical protein